MNGSELETWAVKMAARNQTPLDWIVPVLLYRNGEPALMGAKVLYGNGERILTAAHGFSIDYPACVWSFLPLIPVGERPRLIARATPMRGPADDIALCTPASILQMKTDPLPNFYNGVRRGRQIPIESVGLSETQGTALSVLTGEEVSLLAEVDFEGSIHVLIDYRCDEGESGSVFVDETNSRMYVLRAYSTTLMHFLKDHYPSIARRITRGTAYAVRIRYE